MARPGSTQDQSSGDFSTNIQAGGSVSISGVSATEARQIALDVARSELNQLAGEAANVAEARAEELVEATLANVGDHIDALRQVATDPDFQWVLAQAKISYARSGDPTEKDLLVDLLTRRVQESTRSIRQIAIGESVGVIGKLTSAEIAGLGMIFSARQTLVRGIKNQSGLALHLHQTYSQYVGRLPNHNSSYQHLEYAGCGSVGIGQVNLAEITCKQYFGPFLKHPINQQSMEQLRRDVGEKVDGLFVVNDSPEGYLPEAYSTPELEAEAQKLGFDPPAIERIQNVIFGYLYQGDAAKAALVALVPSMDSIITHWESTLCKNFSLSSVGITIGHAELRRLTGQDPDLAIWVQ